MNDIYNLRAKVRYFSSVPSINFLDLVSEVSSHVPEGERRVIYERLACINGIDYRTLDDELRQTAQIFANEGGGTQWNEQAGRYFIRINTAVGLGQIKHCVAHEFAHVLFDHPRINKPASEAEDEAELKAKEWGF